MQGIRMRCTYIFNLKCLDSESKQMLQNSKGSKGRHTHDYWSPGSLCADKPWFLTSELSFQRHFALTEANGDQILYIIHISSGFV